MGARIETLKNKTVSRTLTSARIEMHALDRLNNLSHSTDRHECRSDHTSAWIEA